MKRFVIKSKHARQRCQRQHPQLPDLSALVAALPNLAVVAFNGGTAAKIGMQALVESRLSLDLIRLSSSSPAYAAVPYAEKLRAWEALRKWLGE